MTTALAAIALIVAFLIQNLEEILQGGPPVPPRLQGLSRRRQARIRLRAMGMVSLALPLLLAAALRLGWWPGGVMIAAALAGNALIQIGLSLWRRQMLPGTLSGGLLMLPAAIWLLAEIDPLPGRALWAALGVAGTAPVLAMVWLLAWWMDRRG